MKTRLIDSFKNIIFLAVLAFFFHQCSSTSAARATTIQEGLANDPKISTFTSLVETVGGLQEVLSNSTQKHTFFVPNNEAFDILGQKLLDNLSMKENHDVLTGILRSHITQGTYSANDISKSTQALRSIFETTISLPDNSAQILYSIKTRQGLIHVVDKVIQR